jgi:hypothetical protein
MKKKAKKEFGEATRASVNKEMAKPRMAKSAREGGDKSNRRANRSGQAMKAQAAVASSSAACKAVCALLR